MQPVYQYCDSDAVGPTRVDARSKQTTTLATSLVLSRLATGPTLLPNTLASLISALSVASRISIRSAALFIEAILESVRLGTMVGMGLTRRALIAAVGSARTMHYVAKGLDWTDPQPQQRTDGDSNAGQSGGVFLSVLDHYTNLGVYVITHVFTLAELFSMAGLSLTINTYSLGFSAAEESVRMLDGLLGSGETSRALASIIALVRSELADDPTFTISQQGVIPTLAALTKTLTAFVCLQAATSKRTAKEMKLRVVYDCTVVSEGHDEVGDATTSDLRRDEDMMHDSSTKAGRRKSRAPSVEMVVSDFRRERELESAGPTPRKARSRTTSVQLDMAAEEDEYDSEELEEATEIVEELTELCGVGSGPGDDREADEQLPEEVQQALKELQEGSAGKRVITCSLGAHYEIEITETTTTTTTTVRTSEASSRSSPQSVMDGNGSRTIARNTRARTRPLSALVMTAVDSTAQRNEVEVEEDFREDEWVEVSTMFGGARGTQGDPQDQDTDMYDDLSVIPAAANGKSNLAALARQDTIDHPEESKQRLQVVLRTMTKKFTQRKRTIRRLETSSSRTSVPSSRESTPKPSKRPMGMDEWLPEPSTQPRFEDIPSSSPSPLSPTLEKGKGVLRAFSKALKKPIASEPLLPLFSSSKPSSRSRSNSVPSSRDQTPPATPARIISTPPSPDLSRSEFMAPPFPLPEKMDAVPLPAHRASLAPPDDTPPAPSPLPPRLRRAPSVQSMRSVVTTCKHTSATPMEEPEPKAANFPRQHLVANLQRFMRYSSAAYGQVFLRILGLGKNRGLDFSFPNTRSPANNHAFAHHVGISVDDILLDTYTAPGGGIFENNKISPIVNYLAVDHHVKAIVLSCRGSLGLSDILVDLTCSYETIHVPDGDPLASYYVHSGMWGSATKLQRGLVHQTIKEALERYPTYGLVLCGHSLGGGVSALLSILWSCPSHVFERDLADSGRRVHHPKITTPFVTSLSSGLPPGRPIHCYAYGPPCVASPDLVRYCRGLVTSTIHNNDVVPTLSLGTLRDLKTMAMNLHEDRSNGTTQEIIGRVFGLYQRKLSADRERAKSPGSFASQAQSSVEGAPPSLYDLSEEAQSVTLSKDEIQAGRGSNKALDPMYRDPSLHSQEVSDDLVVNDYLWSVMRTLRASNDNDKLYPPGEVHVVECYTVFISSDSQSTGRYSRREGRRILLRAVNDVEKRFAEPVFGKTLFHDHSPSGYEDCVDMLARAVLGA